MTTNAVPHILIVDDEVDMRELLCDLVESNGLRATAVADGATMRAELANGGYALLILDLRLRREDGLALARSVRESAEGWDAAIPIMILTGKGDETDRILGLELAADDYLMKPFNPRELLARVRALLRRAGREPNGGRKAEAAPAAHETARFGDWTLDFTDRVLRDRNNQPCPLTPSEFALLEAFCRNANRVLTRDQLLEQLRRDHSEVFDRMIDVLILRLRRKIERNPTHPEFIRTERGIGYLFCLQPGHP
ncbi:winged helix-turn-helix domain-containing protein [Propionivibrio soli]|uniref:winged helix-turn-helix domain-containing protein n=1 Tax=Propionivibrio soli TaxID=2976531 RepID=UPI0021E9275E|nr:response regulator transcription factor [Propionivibrio soli]